jgi:hypothetical protein
LNASKFTGVGYQLLKDEVCASSNCPSEHLKALPNPAWFRIQPFRQLIVNFGTNTDSYLQQASNAQTLISNPTSSSHEPCLPIIPRVHIPMCFLTAPNGTSLRASVRRSKWAYDSSSFAAERRLTVVLTSARDGELYLLKSDGP